MPIAASNGKLLVRPSGGILATDCITTPSFNCNSDYIGGCTGCSCCGARFFHLCISGATGDCAVLNSSTAGWTLDSGGSGSVYTYQNSQVKIELSLSTGSWDWMPGWPVTGRGCGDWILTAWRNDGGWLQCFTASGSSEYGTGLSDMYCSGAGSAGGISFSFRPKERWYPQVMRVTFSGHSSCAPDCNCDSHPYGYFCYRSSAGLDGVYNLPLDEIDHLGTCYWRDTNCGGYSYTVWGGGGCSGSPISTVSGTYSMVVLLEIGGQLRVIVAPNNSPAISPGDEFNGFVELGSCDCSNLVTSCSNFDTRCLAWGYANTSFVRCGNGATATVEAVME